MSLEEAGNPPPIQPEGDEVGREINRNTLLGEYESHLPYSTYAMDA